MSNVFNAPDLFGYNSAYLAHLTALAKEAKQRFEGVPPFFVLIAVAVFVHFSFLVPIYIMDITKELPDLKQVRVAFGVDTTRVKTDTESSSNAGMNTAKEDVVEDIDSILSLAPAKIARKSNKIVTNQTRASNVSQTSVAADDMDVSQDNNQAKPTSRNSGMRRPSSAIGVRSTKGIPNAGSPTAEVRELKSKYERLLSGWVDRHKIYPDAAYQKNLEGNVVLRLRINRKGYVIIKSIETSSGHDVLDKTVLETVSRASPMPVVPEEYPGGQHLEFLIPIEFRL
jgi:TonB family protein